MKLFSLLGVMFLSVFAEGAVLQPRGCAADNCLRAVRNTHFPTRGLTDCSSFYQYTTTPPVTTITVTRTTTYTSLSYSTSTSLTTVPITSTVTLPTTVIITKGIVTTLTSYINVKKRAVTILPALYSSQCDNNASRFSSACACLDGFHFPTSTAPAASTFTNTVTSTVSTTDIVVTEPVSYITSVSTITVFSTATSTTIVATSTVILNPIYIQVTDGGVSGDWVLNTPDTGTGFNWAYWTHLTPNIAERTLFFLHSDTGFITDAVTGWSAVTQLLPNYDILNVFMVDPTHAPYYTNLACIITGADFSFGCTAQGYNQLGWQQAPDSLRPYWKIGAPDASYPNEFLTTQIHMKAVPASL
ncbi:hypothetical protein TWF694_004404 [Orbilia ellipsospora]|uniref:Uncharacterized protein n=1 Tax=Orbilia ellipsospora TaxID=2528407 RepID=A0AAV9WW07_9PEZI